MPRYSMNEILLVRYPFSDLSAAKVRQWEEAGLNVPTAAKRGIYTIHPDLVVKRVGQLSTRDGIALQASLRGWLDL